MFKKQKISRKIKRKQLIFIKPYNFNLIVKKIKINIKIGLNHFQKIIKFVSHFQKIIKFITTYFKEKKAQNDEEDDYHSLYALCAISASDDKRHCYFKSQFIRERPLSVRLEDLSKQAIKESI